MDGNGRWAAKRGWLRVRGHRQGSEVVRMVITTCASLGMPFLTLYAFSSENWKRPQNEIDFLMSLLDEFLQRELPTLQQNNVRMQAIGRLQRLPPAVQARLQATIDATAHNTGLRVYLALSYGGRDELVDACRVLAERISSGAMCAADIDAAAVQGALYAPETPDVDLVLRTAGEFRLSNFLPWQSVYAEFIGLQPLWPDLSKEDFLAALACFSNRERRFGGLASTCGPAPA